jgi:glucan 1,3-beta-glucosidase
MHSFKYTLSCITIAACSVQALQDWSTYRPVDISSISTGTVTTPPGATDNALYPPYTYVPSSYGDWKPHPTGAPFPHINESVNPWHPFPGGPEPHQPPLGLPPYQPGQPSTYWYEQIDHNGLSPFVANATDWKVYRNVKAYGAVGDGTTDDSLAIQAAINDGDRGPGGNGRGTTGAPAVIYFPTGTYLMANPIQLYVDTVMLGNPISRPILQASSNFSGNTLVYSKDPSLDATTNFYITVKNFVLDSTLVPSATDFFLIDWSVSQATQLTNNLFRMPQGSAHTGLAMPEGGSGTFMCNLDFEGGAVGINFNNQQYNIKDVTFTGCATGILITHGFDVVFQGIEFNKCDIGINATNGGVGNVGSYVLLDSAADTVDTLILTKSQSLAPSNTTNSTTTGDDSVVIENLSVKNVPRTVVAGNETILTGDVRGTWVYGNAYTSDSRIGGVHDNGVFYPSSRSPSLLSGNGDYFTAAPPTYQEFDTWQVINVKDVPGLPVYGDGQSDDTANINAILKLTAGCAVTFFPAGTYLVTSTIEVPPGSRLVGEVWSAISASGPFFADAKSPQVMLQVGQPGDVGLAQISDMLFTVADVLPGCILLEINMAGTQPGDVALWNSHFRVGGAAGSATETKCTDNSNPCKAAFLLLHITSTASVYIEDMWGWTADHDLDGTASLTVATGRGMLVESTSPVWLVGTAFEHNALYQYNFVNAANVFVGMQQSETPYWQGIGGPAAAPDPWTPDSRYSDPDFSNCSADDANCRMAWYQRIVGGHDIYIYGSGFWTFFNNKGDCLGVDGTCQTNAVEISQDPKRLFWWNLNTRGVLNLVIDNGQVLATQNNNPGSWGAVVAAILTHSGLMAQRLLRRVPIGRIMRHW